MPLPRFRDVKIAQPQPANMLLRAREDNRRNENLLLNKRRVGAQERMVTNAENRVGIRGQELELNRELKDAQANARGLKTALDSGQTPEQQAAIFEELTGKKATFNFTGQDITLTYEDGSVLTGPVKYLKEAAEAIAKDTSFLTRDGGRQFAGWSSAKGVSFTAAETEKPEKPKTVADKLKQQEFDAKTAYLNGTATDKQKKLFSLEATGKEDPKIKAAQDLYKHFTRKTSQSAGVILAKIISGQLAGDNEISDLGSENELNPADQALFEKTVKILSEYYGVDSQPAPAVGQPSGGITHDFIPGKGLVPRTQ